MYSIEMIFDTYEGLHFHPMTNLDFIVHFIWVPIYRMIQQEVVKELNACGSGRLQRSYTARSGGIRRGTSRETNPVTNVPRN